MTREVRPGSPPSATTKITSQISSTAPSSNSGCSSAARATWDLTNSLRSSKRRCRPDKPGMRMESTTMTSTTGTPVHPALVDGRPLASDELFEVLDPASGSPCALVARCGPREVDAAVQSARYAFENVWRHVSAADRAALCHRMAQVLRDHRGELAHLESLDTGKPISQAYADADVAVRYFAFYAGC